MLFPDSIHHHARQERIRRACHRFGEFQTSATLRERSGFALAQIDTNAPRRFLAQIVGAAANPDFHVPRLVDVSDGVNERVLLR